jgi:hypothetical protein
MRQPHVEIKPRPFTPMTGPTRHARGDLFSAPRYIDA